MERRIAEMAYKRRSYYPDGETGEQPWKRDTGAKHSSETAITKARLSPIRALLRRTFPIDNLSNML